MKDEKKKATEYADSIEEKKHWSDENDSNAVFTRQDVEQAFLAGLNASRPQWHDLRKDPNDLPNGHRVVLNQVGMSTEYDPNRGFLGFGGAGIIAWCEIPTFDKE